MIEWFNGNRWSIWLIIGLILGAAEMLTLNFVLLMLAIGALGGAVTAAVAPDLVVVQAAVALAVSGLSFFFLRPAIIDKVKHAPGYRNSVDQLVGAVATATAEITSDHGEVKLDGQIWNARAYDPSVKVLPGHKVEVFEVDGITLVVYPSERGLPYRPH